MAQAFKRQFRQPSAVTRNKMSIAQKGKPKSEAHKQHISQSLIDYWQNVPNRPLSTSGI